MESSLLKVTSSIDQLTLAQCAVLASVLRSPGYYDPQYSDKNLERLKNRFTYTLDNMVPCIGLMYGIDHVS